MGSKSSKCREHIKFLSNSTVTETELDQIGIVHDLSDSRIQELYFRFYQLDTESLGYISNYQFLKLSEFVHTPLRKRLVYAFDLAGEISKAPKGKADPMQRRPTTLDDFYTKYSARMRKNITTKVFKEKIGEIPDDGGWEWINYDREMMMKPYMSFMAFVRLISVFFPSTSKRTKINFIFRVFDYNQDGAIDLYDLIDTMKLLYINTEKITVSDIEKIAQKIIDEADAKQTGKLDLDGYIWPL